MTLRVNVSVPEDLREVMKTRDGVNWSEIATEAFRLVIEGGRNPYSEIARLREKLRKISEICDEPAAEQDRDRTR
jgi:hypothetical protein